MEPQLSHYTQFFIVLTNMIKAHLITADQKSFIKNNLIKKESQLCTLLVKNCGPGQEQILREALLDYLKNQSSNPTLQKRRSIKSKTVHYKLDTFENTTTKNLPVIKESSPILEKQESSQHIDLGSEKQIALNSVIHVMIDQLMSMLQSYTQKGGLLAGPDRVKLSDLRDQLSNVLDEKFQIDMHGSSCRASSTISRMRDGFSDKNFGSEEEEDERGEEIHHDIVAQITDVYKNLKKIFNGNLNTHLLLMQEDISYENLFQVLKYMVKMLIDADDFTFFIRRETEWEIYSTQNDSIQQLSKEEENKINNELQYIKPQFIYRTNDHSSLYPSIQNLSKTKGYVQNTIIKFGIPHNNYEVIFLYHWHDKDKHSLQRKFINHANEYGFTNEVIQLSIFLVETIIQARVQFFNPLHFSDQIQDIGISFVRISRYLLVEGIKKALETHYKVDKEQAFSQNDFHQKFEQHGIVRIGLRDQRPVTLLIRDMNLQNNYEQLIYGDIIRIQEKYDSYVRLCYEKSAFYKYFLRTVDSILFDFNKKGELIFLSRPITDSLRKRYQLMFDPKTIICKKTSYQEIFVSEDLMKHIEINIQNAGEVKKNQYLLNRENPQFEIFLKVVDDDFKGFAVIFHENQSKRLRHHLKSLKMDAILSEDLGVGKDLSSDKNLELDLKKQIRLSYNKHQTFKFLNQLELNNPGVKNSMISLFIPEHERELNLQKRASRTLSKNSDQVKSLGSPYNRSHANSFWLTGYEQDRVESPKFQSDAKKKHKIYNKFTVDDLYVLVQDGVLDQHSFNIFEYDTIIEKQRVVYAILQKGNFMESLSIPTHNLVNFLMELERKYNRRGNPFHNYDHGVAVMQSTHVMCLTRRANDYLSELMKFTTIVSGLCHDVGHTARTNLFEINSSSKLAIRYHEKSPLEQHHAASTMKILQSPDKNILLNFTNDDHQLFKKVFIQNILYTDIKEHFGLLKNFENRVKESMEDTQKPFGSDDDLKLFTGMIVHTADFNGGAKVFEVSKIWSEKVNFEFMAQYNEEGMRGIPQTPFLKDLDKLHVMAKSEMGFFKVIVRPLWASLNDFLDGELQQSVNNLDNTIISWEKVHYANLPKEEPKKDERKDELN